MNEEANYVRHFYPQASVDVDLLEKNAHDYPYSSLAGFLLLCHYKKTGHSGFEKLSKKTALHFRNSGWLQFLLDQIPGEEIAPVITSPAFEGENKINSGNKVEALEGNKRLFGENFDVSQPAQDEKSEEVSENQPEQNFPPMPEVANTAKLLHGEISFEPLHTVDYFASQGIKISDEPLTNDKLGNQVKSFTAWLKSMKKLHPSGLREQDIVLEKLVQNSAEESNINAEIYTEAMAEVLIKQDKKEKAIEMYNQLSLINPSKSAYFAAKIDNIKSS